MGSLSAHPRFTTTGKLAQRNTELPFVMVGEPIDKENINFVDVDNKAGAY